MSIKLTSAETGRNRSSLAAAVGTSDKIDIATFSATYIKDTPTGWANVSYGAFDTTGAKPIAAAVQINNIYVTDSNFNIIDDTAISTTGGFLKIIGVGFQSGCVVYIQGVAAPSVSFVSSTELRVVTPTISSGTLQVYVVNPDNSVAIRLSGIVASGVPNWVTTSPLTSQSIDIAFGIQLTATSDSTVAYSLQDGSSLPSGTSLSSSGLLSGTISGITAETSYSFTIVATDLELQDTAKLFSVTITLGDAYFYITPLLLNSNTTTWITDASTSNAVITIGNDTRPSAFSPYNTSWSGYFLGSSDYLSIANTSIVNFGTGAYTVEFWYWGDPEPLAYQPVVSTGASGFRIFVGYNSGVSLWNGATPLLNPLSVVLKNAWNFVQVIRSNTAVNGLAITVNGTSYSGRDQTNWGAAAFNIGFESASSHLTGYLSDLRISNTTRSIAIPTSAFTSDSNTKFLTCQNTRFIDSSTANSGIGFGITTTGEVSNETFSPFQDTDNTTGSAYFDGTADYLTITDNPSLEFGTGDFCVEGWINTISVSSTGIVLDKRVSSYGPFLIWRSGSDLQVYMSGDGSSWNILSNKSFGNINVDQWYHFAVYRSSGTIYTALNGRITTTTVTSTAPHNNSGNWYIGTESNGTTNPWQGYISNLRFMNGSSPYGSSNFTPPTSALTPITNTTLLTLQNRKGEGNHRFIDESGTKAIISRFGNASQGSFSPHSPAGWSGYFDGNGDYLSIAHNTALNLSTGNFTIEAWVYWDGVNASSVLLSKDGVSGSSYPSYSMGIASSKLTIYLGSGNGISSLQNFSAPSNFPIGQWVHVAAVKSSSVITLFQNGANVAAATQTATITDGGKALLIGYETGQPTSSYWSGYISNLRILKGTALYSGNTFTVPTTSLTAVANTVLLTCQDNRFKDNSTANSGSGFTVTKVADASIKPFSPFITTKSYSPTANGGSLYIDGTGDYLDFNSPPNLTIGTADFTIEFWVYGLASAAWWCFDCRPGGDGAYPLVYWDTTSFVYYVNTGARITSTPINIVGQWTHVVVSRVSGSTRMFVNGTVQSTVYTDSTSFLSPGTSRPRIGLNGLNGTGPSTGYLSGLKVVTGSGVTSVTVPTAPPSFNANTAILNNFTNSGIYDSTTRNVIETVGVARANNAVTHFGRPTISFPGALTSYLVTPTKPELNFGTGDFTAEFWVYFNSVAADQGFLGGSTTNAWEIRWRTSTGLNLGRLNTAFDSTFAWSPSINTWYHVAVTRSSANVRAFIDGTQIGTTSTNSNTYNSGTLFYVGLTDTSNNALNGYLDDVRITKGYARYTGNFTAPTEPFPTK